jgi:hypothetical protein
MCQPSVGHVLQNSAICSTLWILNFDLGQNKGPKGFHWPVIFLQWNGAKLPQAQQE